MDNRTVRGGHSTHPLVTGSASGYPDNALPVASYHGRISDCLEIAARFTQAGIRYDLSFDGKGGIISTHYQEVLEAVRRQMKL